MKRFTLAAAGLALLAGQSSLRAQPVPAPAGPAVMPTPPQSVPRDPLALPGDNLPPPLAAALAPPRPPAPPGSPPPRPAVASPTLDVALAAAQAALAKCRSDNLTVGTAVLDSLGVIVVGLQMTGANPGRIYNAARKNIAAIEFGEPTSAVRERLRARDFATLERVKPNMTLFPGAVPLISGGKVIGAIGVSGATSEQDEACAAAGAAAVAGSL